MERKFASLRYVEADIEARVLRFMGHNKTPECVTALAFAMDQKILYVNECLFLVFANKPGKLDLLEHFSIFDLTRVYSESETHAVLFFKSGHIDIQGPFAEKTVSFTVHYLHNILTEIETPEVDLYFFPYENLKRHKIAPLMRLKALLLYNKRKIPHGLLTFFENLLKRGDSVSFIGMPEIEKYVDFVLESLNCSNQVRELVVSSFKTRNIWTILASFFAKNNSITRLSIHGVITSEVLGLVNKIRPRKAPKLKQLSFKRAGFTSSTLDHLNRLCEALKITDVVLEKAVNYQSMQSVSDMFHNSRRMTSVTSLTLRQIRSPNMTSIIVAPLRLKKFTVSGGDLEIADVIRSISCGNFPVLEELTLTNIQAGCLIDDYAITAPLKVVIVHGLIYRRDNLCRLFKIMSRLKLYLDLSHSVLDRERWNDFFDFTDTIQEPKITGFKWENNPLSQKLFSYMRRCGDLKVLDMSGTIKSSDHFLDQIADVVQTRGIREFTMRGTRKNSLAPNSFRKIADMLVDARELEVLVADNNEIDDVSLARLAQSLVWNHSLQSLVIPNLQLACPTSWDEFLQKLLERGTPLQLQVPNQRAFATANDISSETRSHWKSLIQQIRNGNKEIPIQEPPQRRTQVPKWESVGALLDQLTKAGWPIAQPEIPKIDNIKHLDNLRQKYSARTTIAHLRRERLLSMVPAHQID